MIKKIDKHVKVVVKIANTGKVYKTVDEETHDPKEELITFDPGNPLPIKRVSMKLLILQMMVVWTPKI
jgi:hypothetical protein